MLAQIASGQGEAWEIARNLIGAEELGLLLAKAALADTTQTISPTLAAKVCRHEGRDPNVVGALFVSTMANSCGANERMLGGNATGGSSTIIERWRPSCQIVSGKWSHSSWQSSPGVMPVCSAKRCMKFTFHGFSGEKPSSRLTCSETEERCSWF